MPIDIYSSSTETELELPVAPSINAGFPSPALDFIDLTIDLNKHIVKRPSATFYGRVSGESMKDAGINDGDLLVIDKSLDPSNGTICVCCIDGEFTLKRVMLEKDSCYLMPENSEFEPIKVTDDNDFLIWGVVTFVIKKFL